MSLNSKLGLLILFWARVYHGRGGLEQSLLSFTGLYSPGIAAQRGEEDSGGRKRKALGGVHFFKAFFSFFGSTRA
jgi:hypothetical protein